MTKHPHEMRQGGQIWRLHHEGSGLPQIDNEERMIVVVISRPDGTELAVFVKRRADRIIDGGESAAAKLTDRASAKSMAQDRRRGIAIPALKTAGLSPARPPT